MTNTNTYIFLKKHNINTNNYNHHGHQNKQHNKKHNQTHTPKHKRNITTIKSTKTILTKTPQQSKPNKKRCPTNTTYITTLYTHKATTPCPAHNKTDKHAKSINKESIANEHRHTREWKHKRETSQRQTETKPGANTHKNAKPAGYTDNHAKTHIRTYIHKNTDNQQTTQAHKQEHIHHSNKHK